MKKYLFAKYICISEEMENGRITENFPGIFKSFEFFPFLLRNCFKTLAINYFFLNKEYSHQICMK